MDMNNPDPSVANLSLSNPACNNSNCIAFAAAANQSQLLTPWAGQFEYGHWTTWYYLIIVFIAFLGRVLWAWNDRRNKRKLSRTTGSTFPQKCIAFGRYLTYRRLTGRWANSLGLPSAGLLTLLLATVLFLSLLTFVARPYYRAHEGYGSPPIAIRTGLMAFACTPILIALAGKANVITLLTGIGHEKLNVIHQWVGWMTLALSLLHTIPFIVAPIQDPYGNLREEFYGSGPIGATMYSGVPPLAMLAGLVALSIPYIRHKIYEGFYYVHILLAITYLGLLFWHAANIMDSWAYLWATLGIWLASYLARAFWYTGPLNLQSEWFLGRSTQLHKLPGEMTRIEVHAPPGFHHRPGQHCFLRFPDISLLDNHPFTIASSPVVEYGTGDVQKYDLESDTKPRRLVFFARTHAGFTRKLAEYCASDSARISSAWIDGPYGGTVRPVEEVYDQLVLVAGGSGITACLPWLQHIVSRSSCDPDVVRVKRIVLVWAMKDIEHFSWVESDLKTILIAAEQGQVVVDRKLFVTGRAHVRSVPSQRENGRSTEKGNEVIEVLCRQSVTPTQEPRHTELFYERPGMDKVFQDIGFQGRTFIIGCGPAGLRADLSNACADAQKIVFQGRAQEVALHLEAFGW